MYLPTTISLAALELLVHVDPGEENLLLDPAHSRAGDVQLVSVTPFPFHPRLLLG